ncbi:MAG TPA: hypothetical protein VE963_19435 [Reyranella sp.]|nr:hypothetical protein [Reyranella sp.]
MADTLTNYFWLHWIYLGLVWGVICLVVVSIWLRMLGVPSVLYCWTVWLILGQASGAYVGPKTWSGCRSPRHPRSCGWVRASGGPSPCRRSFSRSRNCGSSIHPDTCAPDPGPAAALGT